MTEQPRTCGELHTPCPGEGLPYDAVLSNSYVAWQKWARKMLRTHAQIPCPLCGLWAIWLPKAEAREINTKWRADVREMKKMMKRLYPSGRKGPPGVTR